MHKIYLKKYYFIDKFEFDNIKNLDCNTSIIFRNYNSDINFNELLRFRNICKRNNIKFYLSNNLKLAVKLKCDGCYIPSFNKRTFVKGMLLKKKFDILGSAHNIKEIRHKELQGVNTLFISSLFKRNKNYLGINKFKIIKNYTKKKVVALGGISIKNIKLLKLLGLSSFAGITYFKKKTPPIN